MIMRRYDLGNRASSIREMSCRPPLPHVSSSTPVFSHARDVPAPLLLSVSAYNQPQGDEGLKMRAEALSQVLPFVSCSRPRVQNAALWSLERMAEDHTSGKRVGGGKNVDYVCIHSLPFPFSFRWMV